MVLVKIISSEYLNLDEHFVNRLSFIEIERYKMCMEKIQVEITEIRVFNTLGLWLA